MSFRSDDTQQILGQCLAYLKHQVFGGRRFHLDDGPYHLHTVHELDALYQFVFQTLNGLCPELFDVLFHGIVLLDVLAYNTLQIFGIVEKCPHIGQCVLQGIDGFFAGFARKCLYAAYAGSDTAFADDLEKADAACRLGMDATAKLARRPEANHTHLVAILLSEEGDGTKCLGLFKRSVAVFVEREVLTDHIIDDAFHLAQFLIGDFLEVGEVETQRVGTHIGTFLLYMVAQNLLQRVVKQVGGGVVGSTAVALVDVHAGHEVGPNVFGQLLHDVDALVIFALGVDDFHGLVG